MAKKKGGGGGGQTGKGGGTNAPVKSPALHTNRPAKPKPKQGVGKGQPAGGKKGKGKKNPHAGEVYNPGVPSPTVDPFMTAEDIMDYANARNEYERGLHELDFTYANQVAQTGYEKEQISKGAAQSRSAASDDMAARGLFKSSVRDAELFDIDATAEMKKTFLDTQLNTLKLHTETEKARLHDYWNDPESGYLHGLELKKVQNAMDASADAPAYLQEPGWEKDPNAPQNKHKKPKQNKPPKFQHGSPVPNPRQPPPRPTKTGGTQYPGKPRSNPGVRGNRPAKGRVA